MIKSLKELSHILATTGVSLLASREEQILTTTKNLYASLKVKDEYFHEQQQAETKEPWTTSL